MNDAELIKTCGCRYIRMPGPVAPCWWQVVACPDHDMIMKPMTEIPV